MYVISYAYVYVYVYVHMYVYVYVYVYVYPLFYRYLPISSLVTGVSGDL